MQLTTNFTLREFECNDGTPVPKKYIDNVKELAHNLQVLRDEIKKPISINSGYRHSFYNKRIGGAKFSQHLTASASDIVVRDMTPKKLARTILKLIKSGKMKQGGVGLYNGFVHYDIRGTKARWDNSSLFNF
tara:strand:- start:2928 stop:3323 length:396 start_codon:yes stop_codon:yes gene_type:complete